MSLVEEIRHLVRRYGNEAVAQVAVLEAQVLPVDERLKRDAPGHGS